MRRQKRTWRPRRDWGRAFAVFLCAAFALVGAVPLGLGFLVRTGPVRGWAARETSALIADKLGVSARYDVAVQAWPVMVALEHVVVDASDGGSPFLEVERVALRPRPFSLLAGHLDVGDVEIVGPHVRAVVEDKKLKNLAFKTPASSGGKGGEAPIASLAITDARVDATIDGMVIAARELDVDLSTEEEGAYEVAVRAGKTALTRVHPIPGRPDEDAVDDDVICRAEARVRVQGQGQHILVRRLRLEGSADFDPDPGTRPSCELREGDWRAVEVRLGAFHVDLAPDEPIRAAGRIHARLPAPLVHRFARLPHTTGSVIADVDLDFVQGESLPRASGHVATEMAGIDGKVFGKRIDLDVTVGNGAVQATNLVAKWADGTLTIPWVNILPFAPGVPISTSPISFDGIEMTGLLRDLGAHPRAHVAWTLDKGHFDYFKGHLDPPYMEGPLTVQTHGFEIFDRPAIDPARQHMLGVREGTVRCNFIVNGLSRAPYKIPGIVVAKASIDTPHSHLDTTTTIGFASVLDIDVHEGSHIDLSELAPLGTIPISGQLAVRATGQGRFEHPKFAGEIKISDFVFAGLPVGEVESPKVAFEPLVLDLFDARIRHNQSRVRAPQVRLAFDTGATVVADAEVDTREAPGLKLHDLFEVFHFDKDPRFADIDGVASGKARVHYALGGAEDRCGGGVLGVQASMGLSAVGLLGERFDSGTLDADLLWDDAAAGPAGMKLDLYSATLRKGEGSILVGATVRHGGAIKGTAVASGIPLSHLDALGSFAKSLDGTASVVAEIGGTFGALELGADVNLSRLRIGPASLGPSHFALAMVPAVRAHPDTSRQCNNPRGRAFDQAEYDRDLSDGDLKIDGSLFDGQVALSNLTITQQRRRVLKGKVVAKGLDLGTLANLVPGVAFNGAPPRGSLSATLDVKSLPLAAKQRGELSLVLDAVDLEREGISARLLGRSGSIDLSGDELKVPELKLLVRSTSGLSATLVAGGAVHHAVTDPDVDVGVRLEPVDLGRLSADIPSVERAAGTLSASVRVLGPVGALRYAGSAELRKGELDLKGAPVSLRDINVDVDVADGDARLKKATARIGGGTVQATGRMPLRGAEAGAFYANVNARGVKLPVADGIVLTADAELEASYRPGTGSEGRRNLPEVKGTVELTQFAYTRPIGVNVSLSQLGKAQRTSVDAYDPANDVVRFNINLVSPRPLHFSNKLGSRAGVDLAQVVEMDLEVMPPGLVLSGTNQRFGARGLLRVLPDSKLDFRSNEFLVREGYVRFDDPQRLAPKVDVRAQTEYRRYVASTGPEAPASSSVSEGASASGSSPITAAASTSSAGVWRITLQARGETDDLRISLTSDPPLSQEDLMLLLTIGMTRSELDRGASTLGESVGLVALSGLTGADKAVKNVVPLIDEFRFGTGYSSRTARSEPTVTVGKRITDRLRASVTTGVSEDREVRSNVEWRLNKRLSVQGSYDNLNDVSSSPVGNVGVDLRFRLDFE